MWIITGVVIVVVFAAPRIRAPFANLSVLEKLGLPLLDVIRALEPTPSGFPSALIDAIIGAWPPP